MTTPAPETLEREKAKVYLTDAELIRRLGISDKKGRVALLIWQKDPSFPKKDKLVNCWYWPAVQAFLDRRNGVSMAASQITRGHR